MIDWNYTELTQLDRRTRKLMTIHKTLHPKSNAVRLYIPRKEGIRGLQGVKETVKVTNLGLENYVKQSRERLLTTARSLDIEKLQLRLRSKRRRKEQFLGKKKCYMASLCHKLRK